MLTLNDVRVKKHSILHFEEHIVEASCMFIRTRFVRYSCETDIPACIASARSVHICFDLFTLVKQT